MTDELKPCEHCGNPAKWIQEIQQSPDSVRLGYVRCSECEIRTGSMLTKSEAIAAWNRREPIGISDELRLKIEEYINWINAHRDDSGYLNPLYGSQIEAFEIVLDWIDELSLRREDAE